VYAGRWLHSAVYLGKGKVCHARPDQNDTSSGYDYYGGYSGYSYAGNKYSYSNYSARSGDGWG